MRSSFDQRRSCERTGGLVGGCAAATKCPVTSTTAGAELSEPWTMRWKPALNAFAITFDNRLTVGRK